MLLLKGSVLPLNHTWANSKHFMMSTTCKQQKEHFDRRGESRWQLQPLGNHPIEGAASLGKASN